MNKSEIKNYLDYVCACLPTVKEFYRGEIKGTKAYSVILPLVLTAFENEDWRFEAMNEYLLSQINVHRLFDVTKDLPMYSSGSFYTAFTDMDFLYEEAENMSEQELGDIIDYYRVSFKLIK